MVSRPEIERRYAVVREAMDAHGLEAAVVCGSEYSGFEGAVTYMSGFVIVHRYAYVLLPREGDPAIVFPREATYVGEHGTTWIEEQVFVDRPGEWLADRVHGQRVGVYGLDYVMSVRDSVRINTEGFLRFLAAFEVGRTEREVLAPCEEYFVEEGCGRWTMDMVLDGENGAALPEFKIAGSR